MIVNSVVFLTQMTQELSHSCLRSPLLAKVSRVFSRIYADLWMFARSLSTLSAKTEDVDQRIKALKQFSQVLETARDNPQLAKESFDRLSAQTRSLFFVGNRKDVQANLIQMKQMAWECRRVLFFQRVILEIRSVFMKKGATVQQRPPEPPTQIEPLALQPPDLTYRGVDLNIPGTIAYVAENIPESVRLKASEIDQLSDLFEQLPSPFEIPRGFRCPVTLGFMRIPLFDASHKNVQDQLPQLRIALAARTGEEMALERHRTLRHHIDADSFESQLASAEADWAPAAKCVICRHPDDGPVDRHFFRIDAALQEEIRTFLRVSLNLPGV